MQSLVSLGTIAALLLVTSALGAQRSLTWRWSNPTPHGNNIIDMAHTDSLWIQVAEKGRIYTSADSRRWIPRESGTTAALRAVTFFNGRTLIGGESGTILYGDSMSSLPLISLGTDDWIEGVAASPNLAIAVGDNGAVYSSVNGVDWQRQSLSFTNWLRSVAYGTPVGVGMFVTVGEFGFIATSSDGRGWQRRSSPTSQDLNKVVWNNGQFWAVGNAGQVVTSSAGVVWQSLATGASSNLNTIAFSPSATVIAGEDQVRLQEGQNAWSDELGSTKQLPPPLWTYLSAVWSGQSFFLGGRTGMLVEGFKTNETGSPTFWLPASESPRNWLWDLRRFENLYITVGDRATIMSSVDGIDWTQELPPEAAFDEVFLGIGGRTNLAVAVGTSGTIILSRDEKRPVVTTNPDGGSETNQVSTLGIIWEQAPQNLTTADLQGVTLFDNSFVVTGASGTVLTSTNGTLWVRRSAPTTKFLSSVETFPGGLVAVGDDGVIVTSPNGINWTLRSAQTTNWIYRVRYFGGGLIAVGQNGTILTSRDGVAWTKQNSRTDRWLNDLFWIDSTYFVVGNQGTVLASTNVTDWTAVGTITSKSLYSAAGHNGRLIVAGIEGIILRTRVAPIETPVRFVDFPKKTEDNLFFFAGEPDQRFTLDRSTNLVDWLTGPKLEISDSSGTLLYLDERPNAPSRQFFRAKPSQ